jgi:hypothetical protein
VAPGRVGVAVAAVAVRVPGVALALCVVVTAFAVPVGDAVLPPPPHAVAANARNDAPASAAAVVAGSLRFLIERVYVESDAFRPAARSTQREPSVAPQAALIPKT